MKHVSKAVSLLLAAVMLAGLLCACGGSEAKNVPVTELSSKVCEALGMTDMTDPGANYVKGYLKHDASELGEYLIQKNVMGTSIDEFGIFKADKLSTDELKGMIEGYLQILVDSWMNYQPEEKPKLDGAEIKVSGDYVMYCILGDADRDTAFGAFTDALK